MLMVNSWFWQPFTTSFAILTEAKLARERGWCDDDLSDTVAAQISREKDRPVAKEARLGPRMSGKLVGLHGPLCPQYSTGRSSAHGMRWRFTRQLFSPLREGPLGWLEPVQGLGEQLRAQRTFASFSFLTMGGRECAQRRKGTLTCLPPLRLTFLIFALYSI
jgi:hypothetical protein